jgi:hypothetical protein
MLPPLELSAAFPPSVVVPLRVIEALVVLILLLSCTAPEALNPPLALTAPPIVKGPLLVMLTEPVVVVNAVKLHVPVVNVAEVTVPALVKLTVPVVVTDKTPKEPPEEPRAPLKATAPVPAFRVKF